MIARIVRSFDDLALAAHAPVVRRNCWLLRDQEHRRGEVRRMLDRLGPDRTPGSRVDRARTWNRESVELSLERLRSWSLQLFMAVGLGRCEIALAHRDSRFLIPSVVVADFIVAPDPCYFRAVRADWSGVVHRLGAGCALGHAAIVGGSAPEKQFSIWTATHVLERDFERRVPWCAQCEV